MRREVEAVGTNAHELPMVYAALADNDRELAEAPYRVLADWQQDYDGNLLVILPDTYGTTDFLRARARLGDALDRHPHRFQATRSRAARRPSPGGAARPGPEGEAAIFSDGLDVDLIEQIHRHFRGRMRIGYGWGTLLTNDFRGLAPDGGARSVLHRLQGRSRPTAARVKLSDNPTKAMGPRAEVERYKRVFHVGAQTAQPVLV